MENPENENLLQQQFITLLEVLYGSFNPEKNSFESTSNSKIARDLFYSDSQFSRLINGTASQGEFERAVRNVERSIALRELQQAEGSISEEFSSASRGRWQRWLTPLLWLTVIGLLGYMIYEQVRAESETTADKSRYDLLEWSFDNKYIKPYVKLRELPADCDFPCYKYQGKWTLKEEYKIPFFRERNGFHYVAKEARMYANCLVVDEATRGKGFEGYEYQKHEIWYDRREFPIDSFLIAAGSTRLKDDYQTKDFRTDPNYVRIAEVHTFFRGEYNMDSTSVYRTGKVIGRDVEFLPFANLRVALGSSSLVEDIQNEVNAIAQNRLEDLSRPISCQPADVPRDNFHLVAQGDDMVFQCQFRTGRFLVDYTKVYTLEDQYINNRCR